MSGIKRTPEGLGKTQEGAMAVTKVVDRDLVIKVKNPEHQEILSSMRRRGTSSGARRTTTGISG